MISYELVSPQLRISLGAQQFILTEKRNVRIRNPRPKHFWIRCTSTQWYICACAACNCEFIRSRSCLLRVRAHAYLVRIVMHDLPFCQRVKISDIDIDIDRDIDCNKIKKLIIMFMITVIVVNAYVIKFKIPWPVRVHAGLIMITV